MEYRVIRTGSDNELYHYGVKGMKWGHRRANYQTIGNRFHSRAARASQRDADNLRKHGYKAEADAVQKVADKERAKAMASQKKYDDRNTPEAKAARKAKMKKVTKASKQRGEAKAKKLLSKREKTKVSADYIAMEAAHGYEAVRSLLNGNVAGAIGYARRNKAYRDNRKYWEDM